MIVVMTNGNAWQMLLQVNLPRVLLPLMRPDERV